MTKIDIFSGFLGAGKTTLIRKLIKEAFTGEKLVLIENEFGEIGIDGGFLQDAGIEITEMNSGCICCSLVGDFGKALKEVLDTYAPDRILIEPSGVGKLSDVIRAVQDLQMPEVELNSFTTVVDAKKCRMYMKNFGEFFNNQITHAGTIILSHTDGISPDKLSACLQLVRSLNDTATLVATPWDQLTGAQILEAMEHRNTLSDEMKELLHGEEICPECGHHHHEHGHCHHEHHHHDHCDHEHGHCEHEHHHHDHCDHEHGHCEHDHHHDHCHHDHHDHDHHHADDVFVSWGKETTRAYTEVELTEMLKALEDEVVFGTVLRAKGMVPAVEGGFWLFDYVPGEPDVRKGTAGVIGRLCVIGADLNEEAVARLFQIGE